MKVLGIIPARYASTRFPGKPLVEIGGKTMIERVYTQCIKSDLTEVVVATDDSRILHHVNSFGKAIFINRISTDAIFKSILLLIVINFIQVM